MKPKYIKQFLINLTVISSYPQNIFERAKFNSSRQEAGETAKAFITALHKLSEICEFGDLKKELIRDRILV